jgi:hypothetical protein
MSRKEISPLQIMVTGNFFHLDPGDDKNDQGSQQH